MHRVVARITSGLWQEAINRLEIMLYSDTRRQMNASGNQGYAGSAFMGVVFPAGDLIHHSDRGSQYTSTLIRDLLASHQVRANMSGVGNCYDNAPMESEIGTLKTECAVRIRRLLRKRRRSSPSSNTSKC
jgi:transposase InsO family protein